MSEVFHFQNFSVVQSGIRVEINLDRFAAQFNEAQYWLDTQVMQSMVPYMPMITGNLIQRTMAESSTLAGSGVVAAGVPPYGRFLYMGKVMIDPVTRSAWARPGAKKVVTQKPLTYSNGRTDHWFDAAKAMHGRAWVDGVKRIAGGG